MLMAVALGNGFSPRLRLNESQQNMMRSRGFRFFLSWWERKAHSEAYLELAPARTIQRTDVFYVVQNQNLQ